MAGYRRVARPSARVSPFPAKSAACLVPGLLDDRQRVQRHEGAAAPPHHRLRLPGLQPATGPDGSGERRPPLELDGTSARKARIAALKTLDGLGLGNRTGHYPDQLSGGERQRVAIGMPLIAAAVAWLVTLREPPAIARQPLE
jgi:ABC-type dipeptide/oligopeptide/nickel transport system ATPase component